MTKLGAFGTVINMGAGDVDPGPETFNPIGYLMSIGGPGLALDVEDMTTHDQATAWEEVVATVLRSGELSIKIVYDPADTTHDATSGLVYQMEEKLLTNYQMIFPDAADTEWDFTAYVTGFEPDAPAAGGLTANVKMKISGAPTLE